MANTTCPGSADTVSVVALLVFAERPPTGLSAEGLHETCNGALYALDVVELPTTDRVSDGCYVRVVRLQVPVDSHEADLASENSDAYVSALAEWAGRQIDEYDAGTMPQTKVDRFNRSAPGWNDAEARRACGR